MLTWAFSSIFAAINLNFYLEGKVATMIEIIPFPLPPLFFTPKYQAQGGYCLQLLEHHGTINSVNSFPPGKVDLCHRQETSSEILFQSTEDNPENYNYWYLPYEITGIPIIDFQYTSWIPSPYTPIYINGDTKAIFEGLLEIRVLNMFLLNRAMIPVETPPRHRPSGSYTPPPTPDRSSPVAADPPKPTRVKEGSLPTHVIDALMRDAKSGKEACPISMNPYAECEKLSITSCFHIFDSMSIDHWFKNNSTCPVCRKESIVIT